MYYLTKTAYAHGNIVNVATALEDAYNSIETVSESLKEVCGENLFTGLDSVSDSIFKSLAKGFEKGFDDLIDIDANVKTANLKFRNSFGTGTEANLKSNLEFDKVISHAMEVIMFWSERLPFMDEMMNFIYIMNRTVNEITISRELNTLREFSRTYYMSLKRVLSNISLAKFELHPAGLGSCKTDTKGEELINCIKNIWETNSLDNVYMPSDADEDDEDDD